jgi:Immunoglobulin domain
LCSRSNFDIITLLDWYSMFKKHLHMLVLCLIGHCCWASDESAKYALTTKWLSYAGGESYTDEIYALATDSSTNLYFGGVLGSGYFLIPEGSGATYQNLLSETPGPDSAYVAKTDKDGTLLWVSSLDYDYGGATYGLASKDSSTYVVGTVKNWAEAYDDEANYLGFLPWDDAIVLKLNATNGTVVWSNTLSTLSGSNHYNTTNSFKSVAVDDSGSVYAVGYTTMTNLSAFSSASGGKDALVVKYSSAGDLLWVRYLGGANNEEANAVSIGPDGLYVSGTTQSPGSWITRGNTNLPSIFNRCGFLSKIDFNGTNVLYTLVLGGTANDEILSMQSTSNTIFLAGTTSSTNFCAANQLNLPGLNGDGFVLKLTDLGSTCQTNWFRFVGTNSIDTVRSLILMDSNRVVVCGSTGTGGWLPETDEISRPYSGGIDGFIVQLDRQSGGPKWSTYMGASSNETAYALAANGTSLFVGGRTGSSGWEMFGGFQDEWSSFREGDLAGDTGFVGRWSQEPGVPPIITNDLSDVTVHEGSSVSFVVRAQSMPSAKYYWVTNGVPVGGTPTNRFVIASALPSHNDTTYQCIASNVFGAATSSVARLTVIANGTLSVLLSPESAVTAGAEWQLTGGVWRVSGTTNLYPGTYTIAFSNLSHVGWTTPVTRDVVIVSSQTTTVSAVYTAPVATAVRTVTSWTNVALAVSCPPSVTSWTLVENLPTNAIPAAYGTGGWNETAHTLTFTGTGTPTLTYTTLLSINGNYSVSGVITSMPINVTVPTGTNMISRGDFLRKIVGTNVWIYMFAPTNPEDWVLTENLGSGLSPSNISLPGPGTWNSTLKRIRWSGLSMVGEGLVLSYTVSGVEGTSNTLSGTCNLIDQEVIKTIYGDSVVIIPLPPPAPPPPPTILSFVFNGTSASLTFTSVVSQAYMVVTNANLAVTNGWQNCLPATGQGATTTVEVPVLNPQLFYRVKVE